MLNHRNKTDSIIQPDELRDDFSDRLEVLRDTVTAGAKQSLQRGEVFHPNYPSLTQAAAEYFTGKIREYEEKSHLNSTDAVALLDFSIKLNNTDLIDECFDFIKSVNGDFIDSIIERYNKSLNCPAVRSVWFELLVKMKIKDYRIERVIRRHQSFDRVEAVMGMGDYGDECFIGSVEKYLQESAEKLTIRKINPYQKLSRLQNRSANLYIEALSSYIILKFSCQPCSPEYIRQSKLLNRWLLPFLKESQLPDFKNITLETSKSGKNKSSKLDRHPELFILYSGILNIFSPETVVNKYWGNLGYFLGANIVLWETGGRDLEMCFRDVSLFEDEDHYLDAESVVETMHRYFTACGEADNYDEVFVFLSLFQQVKEEPEEVRRIFRESIEEGIRQSLPHLHNGGNGSKFKLQKAVESWKSAFFIEGKPACPQRPAVRIFSNIFSAKSPMGN